MKATFFATSAEFRTWLETHHGAAPELWVGFYRKDSNRKGVSYREALDEALCFGWIDGLVRGLDAEKFTRRFTPRKSASTWSLINVGHIKRLTQLGKMHSAGLAAFARRTAKRTGIYSFEVQPRKLTPADEKKFRTDEKAWTFFKAQSPSYQRLAVFKVTSPKQAATRERWLDRLITASARGRRIA